MGKEREKKPRLYRDFSEQIDRLLAGQDIKTEGQTDDDLRTALVFAKKMTMLRTAPSPAFEASLGERLLQKLEAREVQKRSWLSRLIFQQPIWQAAAAAVIVIIIGSVLWVTGVFNSSRPNTVMPPAPTPAVTVPAATTAAPTSTTLPISTTSVPPATLIPGVFLKVSASTDKTVYAPGEAVVIDVTLQNTGSQTLPIAKYPPILSLMDAATGQPVYTFDAGSGSANLAPNASISYTETWHQQNARGGTVIPGSYYVELEDLDYQGQAVKLTLSSPVRFTIY